MILIEYEYIYSKAKDPLDSSFSRAFVSPLLSIHSPTTPIRGRKKNKPWISLLCPFHPTHLSLPPSLSIYLSKFFVSLSFCVFSYVWLSFLAGFCILNCVFVFMLVYWVFFVFPYWVLCKDWFFLFVCMYIAFVYVIGFLLVCWFIGCFFVTGFMFV